LAGRWCIGGVLTEDRTLTSRTDDDASTHSATFNWFLGCHRQPCGESFGRCSVGGCVFIGLNDAILDSLELDGRQKIVLIAIARHINKPGDIAWPALRTIAQAAGFKKSYTSRIIKGLSSKGFILVLDQGGPRKPAKYDLSPLMSAKGGHNQGEGGVPMSPPEVVMSPNPKVMSALEGTESSISNRPQNHGEPFSFQIEAGRILGAMKADSRPAFADQDHLKAAANGDRSAWRSFQGSISQQTKRFMESIA